jgi:alkanesulfonate monooxygenase SsuD/methylene tetrahydromethanopterin reductase-like flavin-dependent oxidoreductase (luciferase family)
VTLPQFRRRPDDALATFAQAHRLGFAGAFLFDHLWPLGQPERPALECWTLLAALAARLGAGGGPFRLGTLVTRAGLRAPALLAHMAATVAQVARVRLIVGLGMGDAGNRAENEAFGLGYHQDPVRRAAELVRSAAALRDWGRGRGDGAEIWVGGTGHRARGLAARDADGWNGWGLTPEELAAALLEVGRAAEEAGRDPAEVAGTWGGQVLVAESAAEARALLARWGSGRAAEEVGRVVVGDPAAVLGRLAELGEAGASWCVLAPVGGPGAAMRALLAEAADLTPRVMRHEVADR